MAYRNDPDLEFLGQCTSKDLDDLVYCLTHDKDGEPRRTEELTKTSLYKQHHPDHHQYWELIAAEVQCFGANSLVTVLRGGKGIPYKEVLTDVCDKMKVNYNKDSDVATIEKNLLMKILKDSVEKMSAEEVRNLADSVGIKNFNNITPEALIGGFQVIFQIGGFKSYQLMLIIVNSVMKAIIGRGLALAGNVALVRIATIMAGPVGLIITGLLTAIDLAGAAYRVTIPAVIQIAFLRQKLQYDNLADQIQF